MSELTDEQLNEIDNRNWLAQGNIHDLMRAAIAADREANGWQDISTAPKDGTRVLLVVDHGEFGDKVWTGTYADGWYISYGKARTNPTHWMHLPRSPK